MSKTQWIIRVCKGNISGYSCLNTVDLLIDSILMPWHLFCVISLCGFGVSVLTLGKDKTTCVHGPSSLHSATWQGPPLVWQSGHLDYPWCFIVDNQNKFAFTHGLPLDQTSWSRTCWNNMQSPLVVTGCHRDECLLCSMMMVHILNSFGSNLME